MKWFRVITRSSVMIGGMLLFSSCNSQCLPMRAIGAYEKDVSHIQMAWGGYEFLGYYKVKKDLFIREVTGFETTNYLAVETYKKPDYGQEYKILDAYPTLEQYKESPQHWKDITGVLKPGTLIQCTKVLERGAINWGSSLHYYARVIDGPYKGLELDISRLSVYYNCASRPVSKGPDPQIIEQMKNGSLN